MSISCDHLRSPRKGVGFALDNRQACAGLAPQHEGLVDAISALLILRCLACVSTRASKDARKQCSERF